MYLIYMYNHGIQVSIEENNLTVKEKAASPDRHMGKSNAV